MRRIAVWILCLPVLSTLSACSDDPLSPEERFPLARGMGLDPGVLDSVFDAAEASGSSRSLVVERGGTVVAEEYFQGYSADSLQTVWSVTKSFTSTLVGIALDLGLLPSMDATLAELIPDSVYPLDGAKGAITLRHLLTMSAGIPWVEGSDGSEYSQWVAAPNQVAYYLDKPLASPPGEVFDYSDGAAHITSVVLHTATGRSALEFAREYLFHPMGITQSDWWVDKDGYCFGGLGLWLRPRDMVKLGRLFLDGGMWEGERIISEAWIDDATRVQIDAAGNGPRNEDYGHYWWIGTGGGLGAFAALGYGGQLIFVFPELDMVVATTSDYSGSRANASTNFMHAYSMVVDGVTRAAVR